MLPVALEYPSGDWNGFCVYRPARGGRSCERFGGYKTIWMFTCRYMCVYRKFLEIWTTPNLSHHIFFCKRTTGNFGPSPFSPKVVLTIRGHPLKLADTQKPIHILPPNRNLEFSFFVTVVPPKRKLVCKMVAQMLGNLWHVVRLCIFVYLTLLSPSL